MKRIRRILIGVSVGLMLLAVAWVVLYVSGTHVFATEVKKWEAMGGTIDYAKVIPDPVPDHENAAVLYERAFEMVRQLTDKELGKITHPWVSSDLAPIVHSHEALLVVLHEAAARPRCRWKTNHIGLNTRLVYQSRARASVRLLVAEAIVHAQCGEHEEAARSLVTSLELADHVSADPYLRNHLVQIAAEAIILDAYQRLFGNYSQSLPQLEGLVASLDPRARMRAMMFADASAATRTLDLENVGILSPLWLAADILDNRQGVHSHPWMLVPGFLHRDLAVLLASQRQLVDQYQNPYYKQRNPVLDQDGLPTYATMAGMLTSTSHLYNRSVAWHETRLAHAILAGRLRAYKVEHGKYPQTLGELGELPIDPWDGQPIGYQRQGEGFVLTSSAQIKGWRLGWTWQQ